jgi:hypothetical protein
VCSEKQRDRRRRRDVRPRLARAIATCLVIAPAASLRAQPSAETDDSGKIACQQAYESSQLRRRNQQLIEARERLRACGAEACPAIIREDCVQWIGQVEAGIPSIVFEARTDAGPVFDVSARIDGVLVASQFDGRPIELDPGLHTVTLERAGRSRVEQRVILREGEKNRLVVADWTTPKPAETAGSAAVGGTERGVRPLVYVTAGIAALGFADFAIAGALGNSLKSDLEANQCAPFCSHDTANAVRARYVIADIGLGIGVAELATTALLLLIPAGKPKPTPPPSAPVKQQAAGVLVVEPAPSGATIALRARF